MFTLGALCAHDAWRAGGRWLGRFVGALAYAVAFEWAVTSAGEGGFAYGRFLVHGPGGAPLWVPIGWACLCFCAMRTSDRWRVGARWAVPVDAVLVAAVGWCLDPVAVELGWWGWSEPSGVLLLGAPAGNYLAWLLVGASWSASVRVLEPRLGGWAAAAAVPLALLLVALVSLAGAASPLMSLLVLETAAVAAALVAWRRARAIEPPSLTVRAIPTATVLALLAVMLAEGVPSHLWLVVPLAGLAATLPHNAIRGRG